MNNYDFYYPIRFRNKTKNFDNLYNSWKTIENVLGSAYKKDEVIDKYFGKDLDQDTKMSKFFSVLSYRNFEKNGSNIFHFTKELLELLEKTDVSDIQIKNIKFPYSSLYISIRELNRPFSTEKNDDTIIDGIYVNFRGEENSKLDLLHDFHIRFDICGFSESRKDLEFKRTNLDLLELTSELSFDNKESTINDAFSVIHQILKETTENETTSQKFKDKEVNSQLEDYKRLKDNINLIINCIIYISSENSDIERKYQNGLPNYLSNKLESANTNRKKEIVNQELNNFGYSKINIIGKSYKRKKGDDNLKTINPHWRRGHWRNQPFGIDLKENKLIWIKPTIVNKEKGEIKKGHIYGIKN